MAKVQLRLFAVVRVAAGVGKDTVEATTVGEVLDVARTRYGDRFSEVLAGSKVWLNGDPTSDDALVSDGDEVAILPPVSGGI